MNEKIKERLDDLKARQASGEYKLCPRCGTEHMLVPYHRNALSRQADIYICSECGAAEAMEAMMNAPMPLDLWVAFRPHCPDHDLEALELNEAIGHLDENTLPLLTGLFRKWHAAGAPVEDKEFDTYRREAFESCGSLVSLWASPFRAAFECLTHYIVVRFKMENDSVLTALNSIEKRHPKGR